MLNLEILALLDDHLTVKIRPVVCYDLLKVSITTNDIFLDELGNNLFSHVGEGSSLQPLGEVINDHKNEKMYVGRGRLNASDHVNAPHCECPRRSYNNQRHGRDVRFISIIMIFLT